MVEAPSESIRLVIVDDQEVIRQGLGVIVGSQPDLTVVGEASNGEEALAVVSELQPDVVLMDIRMPGMDGLTASATICADPSLSQTKVMVVTTFNDDDNIFAALKSGAGGFIGKDAPPEHLVQSIRALHAGAGLVFPDATRNLVERHAQVEGPSQAAQRTVDQLSPREREVFLLVAKGLTNEEIAATLFIGNATVKTHLNRCFSKLNVRDRAQMVVLAYESGAITPGAGSTGGSWL